MKFSPSPEQQALRSSVRGFLDRFAPLTDLVALVDTADGYDHAGWKPMAGNLGLQGLMVPEELGGSGATLVETALVLEEIGRALVPGPLFPCLGMAVPLLLACPPSEPRDETLSGIASGDILPAVGAPIASASALNALPSAHRHGETYLLSGTVPRVLAADAATQLIIAADTESGPALFTVQATADGVQRTALRALDPTRREYDVVLDAAPGMLICQPQHARQALTRLRDVSRVAVAAEAVGGAQRCLDIAVKYALERTAFGRPIGSFQALKHKMANMYLEIEVARTASWYTAWLLADGGRSPGFIPTEAKMIATTCYLSCARSLIEILGGIGYTWEHPAHLYFKRATSVASFIESRADALSAIADGLLDREQELAPAFGGRPQGGATPRARLLGGPA